MCLKRELIIIITSACFGCHGAASHFQLPSPPPPPPLQRGAGIESFTSSKIKISESACIMYSPVLGQILLTVGEIVRMCPLEK